MSIDFEKRNHIAIIFINRPSVRNALDRESLVAMRDIILNFDQDANLRVAIICGCGNQAFCSGMDIQNAHHLSNNPPPEDDFPASLMRGLVTNKPIIAAINGATLGGGLELMLTCDIRIAVPEATFGFPEIKLGLIPGWGGTQRLVRQLSWCNSAALLLTGNIITAVEAYRIGLINQIVPSSELMSTAVSWAENMAQAAPLAVQAAKEAMLKGSQLPLEEGLQLEDSLCTYLKTTTDYSLGMKAFKTKHTPQYKGE